MAVREFSGGLGVTEAARGNHAPLRRAHACDLRPVRNIAEWGVLVEATGWRRSMPSARRMVFVSEVADLLPQHVPALRRYARALTGDAASADDLVQDCIERALTRAHLWRQPGNLRAWLFTIMHNINANEKRRMASRPRLATIDDVPEPSRPASQVERLMANETLAALKMLSVEHRQVLLLVALEGLQYAEVAEVLGVPVGTVMSRLSRARDRLMQLASGERAAQPRSIS